MGFLRRLFGGGTGDEAATPPVDPVDPVDLDAAERAHELDLARFEQDRTDDLVRRQQRFASYAWTPPAQGGQRRADDADATDGRT